MIDISGGPLRYYISARTLVPIILATDFNEIVQNADKVHKLFLKSMSTVGFDLGFKTKYETLSFLHYIKHPDYGEIFDATWNHPNILKKFIHGRNDTLF
jgi:phage terminase large subunit